MNKAPDGPLLDGGWEAPCILDIDGELDPTTEVDECAWLLFAAGIGNTVEVISAAVCDTASVDDEVGVEEKDSDVAGAASVVEGVKGLASSVEAGMEGAATAEVSGKDVAMWTVCATEEVGLAATASAPTGADVELEQPPGQIVVSTGTVE